MKNFNKKLIIMFVMLLAVIGFGTIQNGTIANAITLTQAEDGWHRYDDDQSNISYNNASIGTNAPNYGGKFKYTKTIGTFAKFNFVGTKIRIIDPQNSMFSNNITIKIDGISYPFSEYNSVLIFQSVVFDKQNLTNREHSVEIIANDTNEIDLDAIDIDNNGKLLPYNEQVESIALDKSSMDLTEGDSQQLTATTTPAAVGVTWASSDSSIANVDSNGNVTAIKEGQATITATTTDGSNLSASCAVNVIKKDTTEPTTPTDNGGGTSNIVNIAHAKGDNTNNAGGEVSIIFNGVADTQLSVVKTADVKSVYVGDTFTYTIVVTNTGSKTAKAVVINDSAPNHIDFTVDGITTTQGKVDPSSTSKNIIVNVGDIPPLGTVTIKIPVTVIL